MPTYDYRCESNGRVIEVTHRMSEEIKTWGELCNKAGIEPENTPSDAPVVRMATGGNVITSGSAPSLPPCASGRCGGGMCGLG